MSKTIQEQIDALVSIKEDLFNAINGTLNVEKLEENTPFSDYAQRITTHTNSVDERYLVQITPSIGCSQCYINDEPTYCGIFEKGDNVTVRIELLSGYEFSNWEDGTTDTEIKLNVDDNITLIPSIKPIGDIDDNKFEVIYHVKYIYVDGTNEEKEDIIKVYQKGDKFPEQSDFVNNDDHNFELKVTYKTPTIIDSKWEYDAEYTEKLLTGFYYTGETNPTEIEEFEKNPIYNYKINLGKDVIGTFTYVFTPENCDVVIEYTESGMTSINDAKLSEDIDATLINHFKEYYNFSELHYYNSESGKPNSEYSKITINQK